MLRVRRLFRELTPELEAMERAGKVDITITQRIDKIIEELIAAEDKWIKNKDVDVRNAFAIYHSLRVIHTVAEQMKQRILMAEKINDNPLVVEQALKILPILVNIQETVTRFLSGRFLRGDRDAIHYKTGELRDLAEDLGLYPSFEEETKGLDKSILARQVVRVASRVAKEFEE